MRRRTQQVLFRVVEIFDYRTLMVASVLTALLLAGYLMVGAIQSAHDANVTANQRGKAATRRIDGLQDIIADQAQTIADLKARDAARDAQMAALSAQVRQLGGQPVVSPQPAPTVYVVRSPSPASSRSRSPRPFVSPSPSRTPRPSPSPSPTCLLPKPIGCR